MAKAKTNAVLSPNLGLYLDRPPVAVPNQGLRDGNNFRIKDAGLTNRLLGWTKLDSALAALNGPVKKIISFTPTNGSEKLVFITPTDVYRYSGSGAAVFLTPIYSGGTAAASGTAVTGTGTNWDPEAKAGDQIHFGAANYTTPTGTWYTIQSRTNDTALVLTASAGVIADGPYTIRKRFTGNYTTFWDWAVFVNADGAGADYLFLTNGIDNVMTWDGSTAQIVDRGSVLGFTCKHLAVAFNMMLYLNVEYGAAELPTTLINSDVGAPLAAGNAGVGLSSQFVVHDDFHEICDAEPLGDNLAVYSFRKVTLVQFLGDPLIFAFRQLGNDIGPIGNDVVADFGDYHQFIGPDTQYQFDGASLKAINGHVWKSVLRAQDASRKPLAFHHFDEENAELIWAIPLTTDLDPAGGAAGTEISEAYTQHYLEDVGQNPTPFSHRDFPMTAAGNYSAQTSATWDSLSGTTWDAISARWNDQSFATAHPLSLAGDEDGKIWLLNVSENANGVGLQCFVTFPKRPTGDGRMRSLLSRVYPFAHSDNGDIFDLNVYLLLSDSEGGAETTTVAYPLDLTLSEGGHFVAPYRRGRFYSVTFGTDGPTQPWVLDGYDLDFKPGGRR